MEHLFDGLRECVENPNWLALDKVNAHAEKAALRAQQQVREMGLAADELHMMRTYELDVAGGCPLIRTEFELDLRMEKAKQLMRPEVAFHPRRATVDHRVIECRLDRLISPGDGVGVVKLQEPRGIRAGLALIASTVGKSGALQNRDTDFHATDRVVCRRLRMTVRENFPKPGQHSLAIMRCGDGDGDDDAPLLGRGIVSLQVFFSVLVQPLDDGRRVRLSVVRPKPHVPKWSRNIVVPKLVNFRQSVLETHLRQFTQLKDTPEFDELLSVEDASYVIVTLRKCARGGPMLPKLRPTGDDAWEASGPGAFRTPLPEYLREFLARLGAPEIAVHDRLNGWLLPPYQAAVRRDEWARAWDLLLAPFRDMRAAYRRLHGGSCAPELSTSAEPRFIRIVNAAQGYEELPKAEAPAAPVEEESDDSLPPSTVPVRGTFVHFRGATSGALRRSGSEPCLELLEPALDDKAETGSQSDGRSTAASDEDPWGVRVERWSDELDDL